MSHSCISLFLYLDSLSKAIPPPKIIELKQLPARYTRAAYQSERDVLLSHLLQMSSKSPSPSQGVADCGLADVGMRDFVATRLTELLPIRMTLNKSHLVGEASGLMAASEDVLARLTGGGPGESNTLGADETRRQPPKETEQVQVVHKPRIMSLFMYQLLFFTCLPLVFSQDANSAII
ncbi:unnamed protein product [Protopolystoma xenopodis]|uniref:Uncharacterized protein n=1 Tax=Protopolystoma xenopodis TaxID=117903 RepID=A0A3S4ZZ05_9PLAT|nr:unnamed protein product [Protopolystoma xenopodis]